MNRITEIATAVDRFKVAVANGDMIGDMFIVGINYKRDGNPFYRGKDGCYEVLAVTSDALAKKEEKQEKKEVVPKILYTVPGHAIILVTHDVSEDKKEKKEKDKPIKLERVE